MILVTGAAGKTGRAVTRALGGNGLRVRALVRRPEQIRPLRESGAVEAIVGDMTSRSAVEDACRGVRKIYHICPNMHPREKAIGQTAIAAARARGVEHFVYHSVLHPQTEAMPHHWQKLRVEEKLFESSLSYTILQPAAYMQNLLPYWTGIVKDGVYRVPYAVETRMSLVDLEDVAAAAATVLASRNHIGATYELCGPEVLSQSEIAEILRGFLGREVRAEVVPLQTWKKEARASGLGDYQVKTLSRMFRYYERHGFWGNSRVLEWLLGRPAGTVAQFVQRIVNAPNGQQLQPDQ